MKSLIAAIVLAVSSQAAFAGDVFVVAPQDSSCGKWLDNAAGKTSEFYQSKWFILGYYAGMTTAKEVQGDLRDGTSATAFMTMYCANNPLSNIIAGTWALIESTGGPKTKFQWKH